MLRLLAFLVCLLSLVLPKRALCATIVTATWYDLAGPMANGKPFNPADATIAAGPKWLYKGVFLVTNPGNGKSIVVSVDDRMPEGPNINRIDLSRKGAQDLGFLEKGRILVVIQPLLSR